MKINRDIWGLSLYGFAISTVLYKILRQIQCLVRWKRCNKFFIFSIVQRCSDRKCRRTFPPIDYHNSPAFGREISPWIHELDRIFHSATICYLLRSSGQLLYLKVPRVQFINVINRSSSHTPCAKDTTHEYEPIWLIVYSTVLPVATYQRGNSFSIILVPQMLEKCKSSHS